MKYLIPSAGRSKTIEEIPKILGKENLLIYVDENEKELYEDKIGKEMVRTHNEHGIGAIRKFMLDDNKSEDFVFMLDDDITGFEYKFSTRIMTPELVVRV